MDHIFQGTDPAELPVEGPLKFELVVNLETARQLGWSIPESVLSAGDRGDQRRAGSDPGGT